MSQDTLSPAVRQIRRVAMMIQIIRGLVYGLNAFIWGPLFFEKFSGNDPQLGIMLTTALISLQNILQMLLEVPTGAIGDTIGRRWTVILSMAFYMLYNILMASVAFAETLQIILPFAIFATVAYVLHYTFYSGTFTAWCVDRLREEAPEVGYEHILAPTYTANFLASIFSAAAGILLYLNGLATVSFLISAVLAFIGVMYCVAKMENERTLQFLDRGKLTMLALTNRMGQIIGMGFNIFRRSPAILALVVIFSSFMSVINLVDYLWPVYLRTRIPADQQSYYWVSLAIGTMLAASMGSHGMSLSGRLWRRRHHSTKMQNQSLRRLLISACLCSAVPIIVLSQLTVYGKDAFWIFAVAVLLIQVAYGFIAPCFETLVNNYIPESHAQERATILSLGSLGRSLLVMVLAIPAGGPSGAQTTIGWAIPAAILVVVALIGNVVLRRAQRLAPELVFNDGPPPSGPPK